MELRKSKALALAATLAGWLWIGMPFPCPAQSGPTNLWTLQLPGPFPDVFVTSSPALAPDGTIYQATFTGKLVAVTPAGKGQMDL